MAEVRSLAAQFANAYDDQVWNEILFGVRKEAAEEWAADELATEVEDAARAERDT